jgi:hypothetical protein
VIKKYKTLTDYPNDVVGPPVPPGCRRRRLRRYQLMGRTAEFTLDIPLIATYCKYPVYGD